MMQMLRILPVLAVLGAAGCFRSTGDMFRAEDGSVIEGKLQSISSGKVVFDTGTADVEGSGRVWLVNGDSHAGEIGFGNGVFTTGPVSIPAESILVVVWKDTDIDSGVFQVDAAAGWHHTGIPLEAGEMLSIRAWGTVVTETGTSLPDGQEDFSSSVAIAPGATSGQLVFSVGENGTPVAAGASWAGESPGAGMLKLAVNVPAEGSIEPAGVYTVSVSAGSNGRKPGTAVFYPSSH